MREGTRQNDGGESMLSVASLPPGLTAGALLAAIAVVAQLVSHRGGTGRTRRTTASAARPRPGPPSRFEPRSPIHDRRDRTSGERLDRLDWTEVVNGT